MQLTPFKKKTLSKELKESKDSYLSLTPIELKLYQNQEKINTGVLSLYNQIKSEEFKETERILFLICRINCLRSTLGNSNNIPSDFLGAANTILSKLLNLRDSITNQEKSFITGLFKELESPMELSKLIICIQTQVKVVRVNREKEKDSKSLIKKRRINQILKGI